MGASKLNAFMYFKRARDGPSPPTCNKDEYNSKIVSEKIQQVRKTSILKFLFSSSSSNTQSQSYSKSQSQFSFHFLLSLLLLFLPIAGNRSTIISLASSSSSLANCQSPVLQQWSSILVIDDGCIGALVHV